MYISIDHVHVYVRVRVRVRVRVWVGGWVGGWVRACVRVCVYLSSNSGSVHIGIGLAQLMYCLNRRM